MSPSYKGNKWARNAKQTFMSLNYKGINWARNIKHKLKYMLSFAIGNLSNFRPRTETYNSLQRDENVLIKLISLSSKL